MSRPDVRIGSYLYRLAGEEGFEKLGTPSMDIEFRSDDASVVAGAPNQPPQEKDLRWFLTSWAGGEGQKVMTSGDELSERRYNRSVGVDLTDPGQIRLVKQMRQEALSSGVVTTTVPASTFTEIVGTSPVSGPDRVLDDAGDEIGHTVVSMAAGQHQVEFFASAPSVPTGGTVEGDQFEILKGGGGTVGNDLRLRRGGQPEGIARSPVRTFPAAGWASVTVWIRGARDVTNKFAKCRVTVELRNGSSGALVSQTSRELRSNNGEYDTFQPFTIPFASQTGINYRYRVVLSNEDGVGRGLWIDAARENFSIPASTLRVRAMDGTTPLVERDIVISHLGISGKVASLTFTLSGATNVSFRFARIGGLVPVIAGKLTYSESTTFLDAYNVALGQGGNIWASDVDGAAAASVFKWDPATDLWTAVASIGSTGQKVVAWAHSDAYQYALVNNGIVYQINPSGSATAYTVALVNAVGITTAASRLYILEESAAGGTRLYRADLDKTTGLPMTPTEIYRPIPQGVTPDTTFVRRMASTNGGPVFFVNQSTECVVYEWNEGSQTPRTLARLVGFQGRAIAHGNALTFVAGEGPVAGGGTKAAIHVIDHSVGPGEPDELGLVFERDGDPDSYFQDLQVYGKNLYAMAHVTGTAVEQLDNPSLLIDANDDERPDDWTWDNTTEISGEAIPADGAYKSVWNFGAGTFDRLLQQTVLAAPGQIWTGGVLTRFLGTTNMNVGVRVEFLDVGSSVLATHDSSLVSPPTFEEVSVTTSAAPANTTQARISLRVNKTGPSAGSAEIWLKDASLTYADSVRARMRLWRVSLQDPGGLFLEQELEIDSGKVARALAITSQAKVLVSNHGGPWVSGDDYIVTFDAYLRTSLFGFSTLDPKRLEAIAVDGTFPADTSVEIRYSLDHGITWDSLGTWTAPESRKVPTTETDPLFKNLQLEIRPLTSDPTVTPEILAVEAIASSAASAEGAGGRKKLWTMVLLCDDENSVFRIDGGQRLGREGAAYILELAATGALVELEDFYFNPDGAVHTISLQAPRWFGLRPGEGLFRIQAVER